MDFLPDSIPPEAWQRLLEDMPWLAIPTGPLVKVLAVGQTTEVKGVRVELLAVEVRETGAVLHWRARAGQDLALVMPDVAIRDDKSTDYRVAPSEGGGGGRDWHGQTMFMPSPPPSSTVLVEVRSFGPPPGMPPMPGYAALPAIEGPWGFQIAVPDE
jgi:hypothetical protein